MQSLFRIPIELHQWLKEEAGRQHRSMNAQLVHLVQIARDGVATTETAPESWVLMRGGYEDPVVVGVVGSQADADAAYSSTLGLRAEDHDRITVVGPFKQGHVMSYDDVYKPYKP